MGELNAPPFILRRIIMSKSKDKKKDTKKIDLEKYEKQAEDKTR
jgi:hypothetical protein